MKTVFKAARIWGISISFHWTFLLLVLWIVIADFMQGIRPEEMVWSIVFIISIIISIGIHEAAHAIVAKYFGIQASGIILLPVGAVASIPNLPKRPAQEILITIAGPVASLTTALLLLPLIQPYHAYWNEPENIGAMNSGNIFFQLHVINLSLALFNLIPAFPMDGGRILRIVLSRFTNIIKATGITAVVSQIIATGFIVFGIGVIDFLPVLIGLFIFFASNAEEYYLQLKSLAHGLTFNDVLMHDYDSLNAASTVMDVSSMLMNNHSKYFIVMEEGKPIGTINRMEIIKLMAEMKYDVKVKDLMKTNLEFINGNEKIENYIEKLARKEERLYPVITDRHFSGVINFRHIVEYLLIHAASSGEYKRIRSFAGLGY